MALATISAPGQISIPPEVLSSLGVDVGDRVEFVQLEPGKFLLLAANRSVTELKGMFGEAPKIVSIDEMNRAVMARWLKARFSDERRARNTVLTAAVVLGTVGFCIVIGTLLLGGHWRS